ncbi:RAMP superfamily CRISPR-associated protein [Thermus sp.]|uniref:RAMP superfamily CRISPR-associated protein n=1 Tax=Thermus sp. TaxID=275 RepID=UPI003D138904
MNENYFDYLLSIVEWVEGEVRSYDQKLSILEKQLKESQKDKEKTRKIQDQIKQVKQNLRRIWTQGIEGDTRIMRVVDGVTIWWLKELPRKEDARSEVYMPLTQDVTYTIKVCNDLDFRPEFSKLPSSHQIALQVDFELLTPWYSKDDRVFHLLDNPVRKDRVFGVPFMAASSWKGLLRWTCRMQAGLREHLQKHKTMDGWHDPDWILHLFGNEKGEDEEFSRGALVLYPTWFDRIGFEVINPHSRERRAGTKPIYYEVVPGRRPKKNPGEYAEGGKGTLSLLYAPWPGMEFSADPKEALPKLLKALEDLLTIYGISAKRTVGWGTARIMRWRAFHKTWGKAEMDTREGIWQEVQTWLSAGGTP